MEETKAAFQLLGLRKFIFFAIINCVVHVCSEAKLATDHYAICESKECLLHANNMMKNMKPTIDPCEDFYAFACGSYGEKFSKNETRTVYDDNWDSLQKQIKSLLENIQPDEGGVSDKLKVVYESCINIGSSDPRPALDALNFLKYVGISNWPNLHESFHFQDFRDTLGRLVTYEEFAFITFKPTPYVHNHESNSLPAALILPGNFLLNSKMKPINVRKAVGRVLDYFEIGETEKEAMWESFKKIEDVGIRLQNEEINGSSRCSNTSRWHTYIEVNCSEEIQSSLKYLCEVWKSALHFGKLNRHFSEDIIHISCRWYHFHFLEKIFLKLEDVNDKTLADYLSIRFFLAHMEDLNFNMTKDLYVEDKRWTSKTPEPLKRWEYCIGWIIKNMNLALGHEYTKKVVTEPVQRFIINVIKDYKEELKNSNEKLNWLDEKVKFYLRKQLQHLPVGFEMTMKNFKNETHISNEYKEYKPKMRSFLQNVLEFQKVFATKKDKTQFNSFYSSTDLYTMDFGFSLLFPPTYLHGLPKLWNYATLGSVIGHELSHNFKSFFDFVHMDEESEKILNRKIQCFVNQYSQYIKKKTGKMITSRETEEEIVADNLGWALTEKIIKEMDDKEFSTLPGLNYTPLQLMYISFAQDACAVLSKQVEDDFYATKPQNLQNIRILGILQNSEMFSETFHCTRESAMNPESKCLFFG